MGGEKINEDNHNALNTTETAEEIFVLEGTPLKGAIHWTSQEFWNCAF